MTERHTSDSTGVWTREQIAEALGYAAKGGSFIGSVRSLRKAGLILEHATGRGLVASGDLVG